MGAQKLLQSCGHGQRLLGFDRPIACWFGHEMLCVCGDDGGSADRHTEELEQGATRALVVHRPPPLRVLVRAVFSGRTSGGAVTLTVHCGRRMTTPRRWMRLMTAMAR